MPVGTQVSASPDRLFLFVLYTYMQSKAAWAYKEFGLASLREAGRDAWLVILARTCRMFAYGANSVFVALFFSALHFSDFRIGLFQTLTLAGDVVLTLGLTLCADRIGRRNTLLLGSLMMVFSGTIFVLCENYWVLLFAAVIGIISASGGDFGPFRAIEESILSGLASGDGRSDVLAWHVTTATLGSAVGTEVAGRIVHGLEQSGWTDVDAYHALFGLYVVMGVVNIGCVLLLSKNTEPEAVQKEYVALDTIDEHEPVEPEEPPARSRIAQISSKTQSVMYKLWPLLIVDSLADGMVNYSLTSYYMDGKFRISAATLGDITSIAFFLAALSSVFSGPLAKRLGLVNTMVFTHVPSSAAVLCFPLPPGLYMTVALLFVRLGLNNMDQAPRAAFIAAAVPADERTAVNGITSMLRTLAATAGPTLTGGLAESGRFWIAFVLAGSLRLAYDFGLWALFINMDISSS